MIIEGSVVKVVDNSGVLDAKCIKVLGNSKKKYAKIGHIIIVTVRRYSLHIGYLRDDKKKDKFKKGKKFRALVIRTKQPIQRGVGNFLRYSDNAVILINKRGMPLSSRIRGPVMYELAEKYPVIGSLTYHVV